MADLTQEQLNFLQTHLNYNAKGYLRKKALKAQLQKFWRRRDKAVVELGVLPPEHPQRTALDTAIKDATTKAESGDLKGAYADLKATKEAARAAANVVKNGLNIGVINADLATLTQKISAMRAAKLAMQQSTDAQSQALIDRAAQLPDPASGGNRKEILTFLAEAMREKKVLIGAMDALEATATQNLGTYAAMHSNAPTVKSLLDLIGHNIALLNQQQPGQVTGAQQGSFVAADQAARDDHLMGNGGELRTEVTALLRDRRLALLDTLAARTTPPPMTVTQSTDKDGEALEGDDALDAEAAMAMRFEEIESREEDRWARAQDAYREAVMQDDFALGMTVDDEYQRNTKIREFSTVDFMEENDIDLTDTDRTPAELADAARQALTTELAGLMRADGVIPDEVFEMCSRSLKDWKVEAARANGIPYDPDKRADTDAALLERLDAAAKAMQEVAFAAFPNKTQFDQDGTPTSFTMDGVQYDNLTLLGEGGGGKVFRAFHPVTGDAVVLKVPSRASFDEEDDSAHDGSRTEAMNHRAVSGGEDGDCPENVLDMKGMTLAPNGIPLIVMDLANAGDAEGYTNAMSACESSGLVSENARQAMMAEQMRDVVKGMRAMQQAGMTHHDLKEANVFLTSDGTFKVADFGLAHHVDSATDAITDLEEFTPGYQPPEIFGTDDVTQKSDNFTLGEILHRITDPSRKEGVFQASFGTENAAADQKRDAEGNVTSASALDRLINSLKEPDPDKRPTLDAVLMSSYFDDIDANYMAENVDRLKKATAEYARTAGRQTADLSRMVNYYKGEIQRLNLSKSDALTDAKIHHYERLKAEREDELRASQRKRAIEFDDKERTRLDARIVKQQDTVAGVDAKIQQLTQSLGAAKDRLELEQIDKKIADYTKRISDLNKQIDDIHDDPQYKAVLDELAEANAAFA